MISCKKIIYNRRKFVSILQRLSGLASEARKAGSFDDFEHDYIIQIKHGLYWHLTDNPHFDINLKLGPRDMSSMSIRHRISPGRLMITSDIETWDAYYNDKEVTRPYAAMIDMSNVPRDSYHQVSRGFGNEFFVWKPEYARVVAVLPIDDAIDYDIDYSNRIPQSEDELKDFYYSVV